MMWPWLWFKYLDLVQLHKIITAWEVWFLVWLVLMVFTVFLLYYILYIERECMLCSFCPCRHIWPFELDQPKLGTGQKPYDLNMLGEGERVQRFSMKGRDPVTQLVIMVLFRNIGRVFDLISSYLSVSWVQVGFKLKILIKLRWLYWCFLGLHSWLCSFPAMQ